MKNDKLLVTIKGGIGNETNNIENVQFICLVNKIIDNKEDILRFCFQPNFEDYNEEGYIFEVVISNLIINYFKHLELFDKNKIEKLSSEKRDKFQYTLFGDSNNGRDLSKIYKRIRSNPQ